MNAITINNLVKKFGTLSAVDSFNLEVPEGSICGFVGPNGSGKTTTIRMILQIYKMDEGEIFLFGDKQNDIVNDKVGYLPEERGLYKKMKVYDMLTFFAELKGIKVSKELIYSWLEKFSLSEAASKKIEDLSKGMSQKVQFIGSILHKPKLLILDEPFSGLDPVSSEVMKNAILELNKEGTTIMFSTHDMNAVENLCDRVCMIYQGKKVLDGSIEDIHSQYQADTIRLKGNVTTNQLKQIEGVVKVEDYGNYKEIQIKEKINSQSILRKLIEQDDCVIDLFEVSHPSLHDIFLRIAGTDVHINKEVVENV